MTARALHRTQREPSLTSASQEAGRSVKAFIERASRRDSPLRVEDLEVIDLGGDRHPIDHYDPAAGHILTVRDSWGAA